MRISYSTLRTLEACPYQYYLKSVEAPERPDCRNYLVGAVCDNLLQDWYKNGCTPGWMQQHAEEFFERYIRRNRVIWKKLTPDTLAREKVPDDRSLLWKRVGNAIQSIEGTLVQVGLNDPKNVVAQRQIALPMPKMSQHQLTGKLDLWDRRVRDLFEMKVTQDESRFDVDQLRFYALLIWLQEREDVRNLYFFAPIRKQSIVPVPYNRVDLKPILERSARAIRLIESGKFEPVGRMQVCHSCDYRMSVCPCWQNAKVVYEEKGGKKLASFGGEDG